MQRSADRNTAPIRRRWTRHPRTVGRARAELRRALGDWGLSSIEGEALLVLSELLTNAVVHARVPRGREIETCFRREGDTVWIAVDDADGRRPVPRPPQADGGRGLMLVAALADRWGVSDRDGVGKSVWAVLAAPQGKGSG